MSHLNTTKLSLPVSPQALGPAAEFVTESARRYGIKKESLPLVKEHIAEILNKVGEKIKKCRFEDHLKIETFCEDQNFVIHIKNLGTPLFTHEVLSLSKFMVTTDRLEFIKAPFEFKNQGREGQIFTFKFPLENQDSVLCEEKVQKSFKEKEAEIRKITGGEEEALTSLFHSVYGYDYIHEWVYFPEAFKAKIENKDLVSLVAVSGEGKLIGHVGLLRQSLNPLVYEAALGVVDPTVKSQGLFQKLFSSLMDVVRATPMSYCIFDFVTNHDYSQRIVAQHGMCEMALFLGCQIKKTQAQLEKLGIGDDPKLSDRYSLLLGIHPCQSTPFGKALILPESLGEMFEFLLEPLGVSWAPTSRFDVLPLEGSYLLSLQVAQQSAYFDFKKPGSRALDQLLGEWSGLRREGYKYAAIDVPLRASGLGQLQEYLRGHGFFVSGFVPFKDELGFRFQSIAPAKVDFSEIKVSTPRAKKLVEVIQKDFERNAWV